METLKKIKEKWDILSVILLMVVVVVADSDIQYYSALVALWVTLTAREIKIHISELKEN